MGVCYFHKIDKHLKAKEKVSLNVIHVTFKEEAGGGGGGGGGGRGQKPLEEKIIYSKSTNKKSETSTDLGGGSNGLNYIYKL